MTQVLHWKSYVILYEKDEGLVRLQAVLKSHGPADDPVTVRQLSPGHDNRLMLKEIYRSRVVQILLDCEVDNIIEYLRQARNVKLFGEYYSFFITSLDAHTVDLSEFRDTMVNITALRIVDPNSLVVQDAVEDWRYAEERSGRQLGFEASTVKMETALMYDAVQLFAKALHQLDSGQYISVDKISCDHVTRWQYGSSIRNYMALLQMQGMTGLVKFDVAGRRTDFNLEVIEYTREAFKKIGTWDLENGVVNSRIVGDMDAQISQSMHNKTFIVSSKIGPPYLMWKYPLEGRVGNDRFQGYSMDLISHIAEILDFKFEFRLTSDGSYGNYNPETKKWNGLVKDLLRKNADLAICDLTITHDREKVVDFTNPFMTLGISILYSRQKEIVPSLFSFLDPLEMEVWLYMATTYLCMSIIFFVMARMSQDEWLNPHPCNKSPDVLENSFTIVNSMYVAIRFMMRTGCDILPKAVSTRVLSIMWWFFALIMISSYTANLAASLTVTRKVPPINSVEDLAMQNTIKYGTVEGQSTAAFFQKSNHVTYQRMWATMVQAKPTVFMVDNGAGVQRVRISKGRYAFLMESTQIEYDTAKDCNLIQIGGHLDTKGYGIGLPQNSPYRTTINGAILQLQESGKLRAIKNKWWKEMIFGGSCLNRGSSSDNSDELNMSNVGGVFLVLLVGTLSGLFVAVLELLWNCRKIAIEEAITPWKALVQELKFIIKFSKTKPVKKKKKKKDETKKTKQRRASN